jgi:hypothetical protein
VRHLRADARDRRAQAGAGDDDQVDLVRRQSAVGQCLAAGRDRHLDQRLVVRGPAPLRDADPGPDPLVVGVHHRLELGVGDPAPWPVPAQAEDAGAGGALRQLDRGHACSSLALIAHIGRCPSSS